MGRIGLWVAAVALLLAQSAHAGPSASAESEEGPALQCGQIAPFQKECRSAEFAPYSPGATLEFVTIGFTGRLTITLEQRVDFGTVHKWWACETVALDDNLADQVGNPPFVSPVCEGPYMIPNFRRDLEPGFPVQLACKTSAFALADSPVIVGAWGPYGCRVQF